MLKTQDKVIKTGYIYREAIVKKLNDIYKLHPSLIAINFNKVNSKDLIQLRQSLGNTNAKLLVTKLSLFRRFLKKLKKDTLLEASLGPAGLIFVAEDIVGPTKVVYEFAKEHEDFKLLGAFLEDKEVSNNVLEEIAKLPSKQQLIAKAVYAIKFPLIKFRAVCEQLMRKLLLCLISAKEQKEKKEPTKEPKEEGERKVEEK